MTLGLYMTGEAIREDEADALISILFPYFSCLPLCYSIGSYNWLYFEFPSFSSAADMHLATGQ